MEPSGLKKPKTTSQNALFKIYLFLLLIKHTEKYFVLARTYCGLSLIEKIYKKPQASTRGRIPAMEGKNVPRKGHVPKRVVLPDPVYKSRTVTKLINAIMLDGKKGVAQRIVYAAFNQVEEKRNAPAIEAFEEALNNIMPATEVKARRVGGATYQVPIEIRADRRQALGLRWLVSFARKRSERTMEDRLANEILDAVNNTGGAVRKKRRNPQNG
jgi:small subunit ribosomal protein S7